MFKVQIPDEDGTLYMVYNKGEYFVSQVLQKPFIDNINDYFDVELVPSGECVFQHLITKTPMILNADEIDYHTYSGDYEFVPYKITDEEYNTLLELHKLQWPDRPKELTDDLNTARELLKTPQKIKKLEFKK